MTSDMGTQNQAASYLRACQSPFWQQVFAAELDYLRQHLRSGDEILSVGCGPALIERGLGLFQGKNLPKLTPMSTKSGTET